MLRRAFRKASGQSKTFYATVVAPTVLSILYFGLFASDVYISESRFVVRSAERPVMNGLGAMLKSAGFSGGGTEVYVARDFVLSRDALNALNARDAFRSAYGGSGISIFNRFDPLGVNGSSEALYDYYQHKVSLDYDSSSAISTLRVRAFSPQDAERFNALLLGRAEELVNRLSQRAQQDIMRRADEEVETAKRKAALAAVALAAFRNRERIVDPEKQAEIGLEMVSKLQDELIETRTTLAQVRRLTPENPQIELLETRAASLSRQIGEENEKVTGSRRSLAASAVRYQRLLLDNQFAEKQLAMAMTTYEDARTEAIRKQAYVERIVQPSRPDEAQEPRRARGIGTTVAMGLVAWGILTMLIAGVREHRD
jgi:capsular polysaccharide transport system permease protein